MVAKAVLLSCALHPNRNYVTVTNIKQRAERLLGMDDISAEQILAVMHKLKNKIDLMGFGDEYISIARNNVIVNGGKTRQNTIKIIGSLHLRGSDIKAQLLSMGYTEEETSSFLVC
jgi:hypothetical protein